MRSGIPRVRKFLPDTFQFAALYLKYTSAVPPHSGTVSDMSSTRKKSLRFTQITAHLRLFQN
jgi:hypothetical protein